MTVNFSVITVRNSSCVRVMFSQASVILSTGRAVHGGGRGMCGRGCAWQGACVAGGVHDWGICGRGACMAGETTTAADDTHPTGMHSCSEAVDNNYNPRSPCSPSGALTHGQLIWPQGHPVPHLQATQSYILLACTGYLNSRTYFSKELKYFKMLTRDAIDEFCCFSWVT